MYITNKLFLFYILIAKVIYNNKYVIVAKMVWVVAKH